MHCRSLTDNEIVNVAEYYNTNNTTYREMENVFYVSKSLLHRCLTVYLEDINVDLYKKVMEKGKQNQIAGRIKGGKIAGEKRKERMND